MNAIHVSQANYAKHSSRQGTGGGTAGAFSPPAAATWPKVNNTPVQFPARPPRRSALRLGYVPLVHAAPLFAAAEFGFFRRHGLDVRLCRELGWASIREKIIGGELDAAQALAPMPLALTLGIGSVRCPALTALVLNLHGNALVVARRLWMAGLHEDVPLAQLARRREEPLTFAIVHAHSSHAFLLKRWLGHQGLAEGRDFRLVVVPPPQMVHHLRAGHVDGCCVGEPWGTLAVQAGVGVITALSAELAPDHPEKVLLVREVFAESRHAEHLALVAALLEACAWCASPANRPALLDLLADRAGLQVPRAALEPVLTGDYDLGACRRAHQPEAIIFHGGDANEPGLRHARWIAGCLDTPGAAAAPLLQRTFRADLYRDALSLPVPSRHFQPESILETHLV